MNISKYKKCTIWLFTSLLLFSCTTQLQVNDSIILEALDELSINVDLMIADDRVDNDEDPTHNLTEMVDARDKQAIYIFINQFDEPSSLSTERFFYITPDYVYEYANENMTRIENQFEIAQEDYYQNILTTYTTLIDLDYLTNETFISEALELSQPSLTKSKGVYTLKGLKESSTSLADDEVLEYEYNYSDIDLKKVSHRRRYSYASTWEKSNFIAGIDYFFGNGAIPDFPPISEFGY